MSAYIISPKGRRVANLAEKRFGRLTVSSFVGDDKHGNKMWQCRCDCGNAKVVRGQHLKAGLIRSCGCFHDECSAVANRTHGKRKAKVYSVWGAMLARCRNPNNKRFKDYGGRGIKICESWLHFENFLADMGEPPEGGTLDRIDGNGNYAPGNCTWSTHTQQARNRRSTVHVTVDGVTKPLGAWVEESGLKYATVWRRIFICGWSPKDAITLRKFTSPKS